MDQWESLSHFILMDGYGKYVWGSYGIVLLCFLVEIFGLNRRRRKAAREVMLEARAHQAEEQIV